MDLKCVGRYRSDYGTFTPGQMVEGDDELKALLLRDSPTSFAVVGADPEPDADNPELGAMSTETATGVVAPDRRQRSGRNR